MYSRESLVWIALRLGYMSVSLIDIRGGIRRYTCTVRKR